jgi:UDP-N-acetylglucosamine:LPS N-acetylglucosamine transferase
LNPASRIVTWYANRMLAKAYRSANLRIFADDPDSAPLRSRNKLQDFLVSGPILPPSPVEDKQELKKQITRKNFPDSTDNEKLVVVSVGGTSAGKYLVDYFIAHREALAKELHCLFLLLPGPRIEDSTYRTNQGKSLRILPFATDTLSIYKAADCVVCQSGASTLNEVASVGTPCVTVPISNHFEQEANAKRFEEKYGFLQLSQEHLSVPNLVNSVNDAVNQHRKPEIDFSTNAEKAANAIRELASA